MKTSAGLVIIQDNKILLGHPTGAPWLHTYSIPKGEVEGDESALEAALRETKEELGIEIDPEDVTGERGVVEYKDNKGIVYKKVYFFLVKPSKHISIDQSRLQKDEIDWAGFMSKKEAENHIFIRFYKMLDYLS